MSFDAFAVDPSGDTVASAALGGQQTVTTHWGETAAAAGLPWLGLLDGREVIVPTDQLPALRVELLRLRSLWAEGGELVALEQSADHRPGPLRAGLNQRADALDALIDRAQQIGGSTHIG